MAAPVGPKKVRRYSLEPKENRDGEVRFALSAGPSPR